MGLTIAHDTEASAESLLLAFYSKVVSLRRANREGFGAGRFKNPLPDKERANRLEVGLQMLEADYKAMLLALGVTGDKAWLAEREIGWFGDVADADGVKR